MRKKCFAVCISNNRVFGTAVCKANKEANACDWFTCFCIGLYDLKAWLFFVENNYLRFLTCKQFNVVFGFIKNIVCRCFYLFYRVNTGIEIVNYDITVNIRNSVKVVTSVFNFCNSESSAGQIFIVVLIVLDNFY